KLKRVVGELEDVPGDGDALDLCAEDRDAVGEPEQPEVAMAQRLEGVGSGAHRIIQLISRSVKLPGAWYPENVEEDRGSHDEPTSIDCCGTGAWWRAEPGAAARAD